MPRHAVLAALIRVATFLGVWLVCAAYAGPGFASDLAVPLNEMRPLTLSRPAASVIVGNPGIADAVVTDSHTVFVLGRGYGSTNVLVLDQTGGTLFDGEIIVTAQNAGAVTVHHGLTEVQFSCASRCQTPALSSGAGASAGVASSSKDSVAKSF